MTTTWRGPDPAVSGQVIDGRYRLGDYIDGGSFGEVWQAWDPRLGRHVAIKLLVAHHDPDVAEGDRSRFEREAKLTAGFDGEHHIVKVFDYGQDRGRPYLVMKLMQGQNLQHVLSGDGRMRPPRAVGILDQVAEALGEAHRNGLVHRDVKPANVFVEAGDKVTLLDFGMLGALDRRRARDLSSRGDLGGGTLEYMAPERFFRDDGGLPTEPSKPPGDIYSLGCLLYQCLTGRRPFLGRTEEELQYQHRHGPRPRLGAVVRDRDEFEAVVAQTLAVDPDHRPPSPMDFMQDVKDALAAWERRTGQGEQTPAVRPSPPPVTVVSPDDAKTVPRNRDGEPDRTEPSEPRVPPEVAKPRPAQPPPGRTGPRPEPGSHGAVLVGGASAGIVGAGAVLVAGTSPIASALAIAASWAAGASLGWWYGSRDSD